MTGSAIAGNTHSINIYLMVAFKNCLPLGTTWRLFSCPWLVLMEENNDRSNLHVQVYQFDNPIFLNRSRSIRNELDAADSCTDTWAFKCHQTVDSSLILEPFIENLSQLEEQYDQSCTTLPPESTSGVN